MTLQKSLEAQAGALPNHWTWHLCPKQQVRTRLQQRGLFIIPAPERNYSKGGLLNCILSAEPKR